MNAYHEFVIPGLVQIPCAECGNTRVVYAVEPASIDADQDDLVHVFCKPCVTAGDDGIDCECHLVGDGRHTRACLDSL